jgi:predicted Ser/Thr protein kinase
VADTVAPEFVALQQAVAGRYSLERELGRGGMGIVFLARDVALDRLVAIKLLPPLLAARPGLRERFLREARTAARLSQPNIVPIFSVEEAGDLVFFVMAFIEGQTLGDRLRTKGPLSPAEVARLVQEVAWALGYAHGRGVVHRDVKPDNIMLEQGSGRAVIMDFGIAAATGDHAEAFGTAHYVSPEQASALPTDGRSDLYSLGVVAFVALTGQLPFDAPDAPTVLAMHLERPAPLVLSVAPGMPRKLAQAIDRCLSKLPDERFQDGEALASAVSTSIERARELPAPVRAWIVKGRELQALYTIWAVTAGTGSWFLFVSALSAWLSLHRRYPFMHFPLASLLLFFGVVAVPFGINAIYRLVHTRKLLEAGYNLDDIRLALRAHAERRHEELLFERSQEPNWLAKMIRKVAWGGFATFAGVCGIIFAFPAASDLIPNWMFVAPMLITTAAAVVSHIAPGIKLPPRDAAIDRRLRWWNGWFGRLTAKIAGWKLRRPATAAELTYRPTEMAIGLAADALFASLPKEQRRDLKDLPAVMERLQRDAALMRRTVEELNGSLAGLGEGHARSDERARLHADLVASRDEASARLADAVAALESIRMSLLKLKAGTGSVGELTQDLAAARALTDAMEFVVQGNAEVERLLGPKRTPPEPMVPAGA